MTFDERKQAYIQYMKLKMEEEDWHGVADAAMDLRELEAEVKYPYPELVLPHGFEATREGLPPGRIVITPRRR